MKQWSASWKGSRKRKKQIKYMKNAPLHIKRKFMISPLSKELRKKHNRRNLGVTEGDKVKIIRGQFKKTSGKVTKVNTKRQRIYIEGVEVIKKDGSKAAYPIHASNVIITEINLDDKKRKKILDRKVKGAK